MKLLESEMVERKFSLLNVVGVFLFASFMMITALCFLQLLQDSKKNDKV